MRRASFKQDIYSKTDKNSSKKSQQIISNNSFTTNKNQKKLIFDKNSTLEKSEIKWHHEFLPTNNDKNKEISLNIEINLNFLDNFLRPSL